MQKANKDNKPDIEALKAKALKNAPWALSWSTFRASVCGQQSRTGKTWALSSRIGYGVGVTIE